MSEYECYRKLYGELSLCVPHYNKNKILPIPAYQNMVAEYMKGINHLLIN